MRQLISCADLSWDVWMNSQCFTKRSQGVRIRFALAGVSEFRRFSGLGLVPYDGCAVIVFSEPLGASLHSAILGQPKEDWSGATIFLFSTEREGTLRSSLEQSNLFVTQLGSNVLIVATDRNSLHSLMERQAGSQDWPSTA